VTRVTCPSPKYPLLLRHILAKGCKNQHRRQGKRNNGNLPIRDVTRTWSACSWPNAAITLPMKRSTKSGDNPQPPLLGPNRRQLPALELDDGIITHTRKSGRICETLTKPSPATACRATPEPAPRPGAGPAGQLNSHDRSANGSAIEGCPMFKDDALPARGRKPASRPVRKNNSPFSMAAAGRA